MYESSRGNAFRWVFRAQAGRCVDKEGVDERSVDERSVDKRGVDQRSGIGRGFLLAGTFGILLACSSNDSAPKTGVGGSGSNLTVDAGRASPGEGFEATPDFDITNPQRPVPPREQLVAGVASLNGLGGAKPAGGVGVDGGTDAGADAGR